MAAQSALSQNAPSNLLRQAVRGNSIFSFVSGAVFLLDSGPIAALLGVPNAAAVISIMGLGIVIFAAFLFFSTMKTIYVRLGRVVFALDAFWVIASLLILVTDTFSLSPSGKWLVLILADVVLVFAVLEYLGLRRLR
jgi:hypothetical protein